MRTRGIHHLGVAVSNLDGAVDFKALCAEVHATIMASGLFELGAVRVRAIRCEAYAVADRLAENAHAWPECIDLAARRKQELWGGRPC